MNWGDSSTESRGSGVDGSGTQLDRREFMKKTGTSVGGAMAGFSLFSAGKHGIRQGAAGILDTVLPGSMYAVYQLDEDEYIGTVDADLDETETYLKQNGYGYQMLAAKKLHPEDERSDDGSYRRLDPDDSDKQWHVHLWNTDDGVEVYSHYEYKPELWGPVDESRVAEHYRPDDNTYIEGQHAEDVKHLLEEHGEYNGDPEKCGSTELAPPDRDIDDITG